MGHIRKDSLHLGYIQIAAESKCSTLYICSYIGYIGKFLLSPEVHTFPWKMLPCLGKTWGQCFSISGENSGLYVGKVLQDVRNNPS